MSTCWIHSPCKLNIDFSEWQEIPLHVWVGRADRPEFSVVPGEWGDSIEVLWDPARVVGCLPSPICADEPDFVLTSGRMGVWARQPLEFFFGLYGEDLNRAIETGVYDKLRPLRLVHSWPIIEFRWNKVG